MRLLRYHVSLTALVLLSASMSAHGQGAASSTQAGVSESERMAIAAIHALVQSEPASVLTLDDDGHVVRANLSGIPDVTDDMVAHVAAFSKLEELFIAVPDISDEGMKHLIGLNRLWRIDLEGTAITDAGIKSLLQLPSIRDISVRRCSITDEALSHFAKMKNLTRIRAVKTYITDSGLEHLKDKANLELLDLRECNQLSDAGIAHLQGLTNLKVTVHFPNWPPNGSFLAG